MRYISGMIHELWMNGLVWDLTCEMNECVGTKGIRD